MTSEERLKICEECPLYEETDYGPKCCNRRYLSKDNKVSWFPKSGYYRGCGCYLRMKTKNPNSHCGAGKW